MCFAAKAIYVARTFSRLFVGEMMVLKKPSYRIRVTARLENEFSWWAKNAPYSDGLGLSRFGHRREMMKIATDASFSGLGAVFGASWLAGAWSGVPFNCNVPRWRNWVSEPFLDKSIAENINFWNS